MFRWSHKAVRRKIHETFYEIAEEPKNLKHSEMIFLTISIEIVHLKKTNILCIPCTGLTNMGNQVGIVRTLILGNR